MFAGLCLQIWYDVFSKILMLLCQFLSCGTVGWQEFIDNEGGPDTDATRSKLRKKMNFDKELKDPEFPNCYLTMFKLKSSSRVIPCFLGACPLIFEIFCLWGQKLVFLFTVSKILDLHDLGTSWLTYRQIIISYIFSLEKGPPLFIRHSLAEMLGTNISKIFIYVIHLDMDFQISRGLSFLGFLGFSGSSEIRALLCCTGCCTIFTVKDIFWMAKQILKHTCL